MKKIIYINILALSMVGLEGCDYEHPRLEPRDASVEQIDGFFKDLRANPMAAPKEIEKYFVNQQNVNTKETNSGYTPLMLAAELNNELVVRYLLKNGAHPNDVMEQQPSSVYYGYSALLPAVARANIHIVQVLLDFGADPRVGPLSDKAPLIHRAVMAGNINIVEEFLKKDKSLARLKNIFEETPLHLAAYKKRGQEIKLLLRYGADKYAKNKQGKTAWDLANDNTKKAFPELKP